MGAHSGLRSTADTLEPAPNGGEGNRFHPYFNISISSAIINSRNSFFIKTTGTGIFEEFGTVESVKIIIDRNTDRSKGFGFLDMDDNDAANAAIAKLNGTDLDGRTIKVNEARPRENNY